MVCSHGLRKVSRHYSTLAGVPNLLGATHRPETPNKLGTPVPRSCQATLQTPWVCLPICLRAALASSYCE